MRQVVMLSEAFMLVPHWRVKRHCRMLSFAKQSKAFIVDFSLVFGMRKGMKSNQTTLIEQSR